GGATPIAGAPRAGRNVAVCVNGNETRDWRQETAFLAAMERRGFAVLVVDPRGVGPTRPGAFARAGNYADPLEGVEENLAYNAFLVGKSLLGMRVADVLAALRAIEKSPRPRSIVVCGRRDAA